MFSWRPIYWPAAGGYTVLGCNGEVAETQAISANGQVVVGQGAGAAMAWHAPASCTETLPPLEAGGEVVGVSGGSNGTNTAFFWSQATGMLQLPANRWGAANTVSDVRADGTRLVAGTNAQANAVVWTVRLP